jgi:DNA-binding HxlR family transcriptional regulator
MALLDILGRRWTLRILWELRGGSVKFRDLAERADSMSQSVLSRRLKELEAARLVVSDQDGWRLSSEGSVLLERLTPLSEFARQWVTLISQTDSRDAGKSEDDEVKGGRWSDRTVRGAGPGDDAG